MSWRALDGNKRLQHGKHRFASFWQVCDADRSYCAWVCNSAPRSLPSTLALFKDYIWEKHGGVVQVGKYKGMFFDELLDTQPEYCAPGHRSHIFL